MLPRMNTHSSGGIFALPRYGRSCSVDRDLEAQNELIHCVNGTTSFQISPNVTTKCIRPPLLTGLKETYCPRGSTVPPNIRDASQHRVFNQGHFLGADDKPAAQNLRTSFAIFHLYAVRALALGVDVTG